MVFVDTSVLLNLLDVPGNNDRHQADVDTRDQLLDSGFLLILPVTTVIETGNAIARDAGGLRHDRSRAFVEILRATLSATSPWAASDVGLTNELLGAVLDGHQRAPGLRTLMTEGVGSGDACILAEVAEYRTRISSAYPVRIWSHDRALSAYSG